MCFQFWNSARRTGYFSTLILSRREPLSVRYGMGAGSLTRRAAWLLWNTTALMSCVSMSLTLKAVLSGSSMERPGTQPCVILCRAWTSLWSWAGISTWNGILSTCIRRTSRMTPCCRNFKTRSGKRNSFSFTGAKTRWILAAYHIDLNLTSIILVVRGATQVLRTALLISASAAISGISGIGHILRWVSVWCFCWRKSGVTLRPHQKD